MYFIYKSRCIDTNLVLCKGNRIHGRNIVKTRENITLSDNYITITYLLFYIGLVMCSVFSIYKNIKNYKVYRFGRK